MKTSSYIIALLITVCTLLSSCNKHEESDPGLFSYPDSGFYGLNILNAQDTIYYGARGPDYSNGEYNSMKAVLPSFTSKLRITIEGKSYTVYRNQGWFQSGKTFQAEGQIVADLRIHFSGDGEATIKFYEDDLETPARIKNIKIVYVKH